MCASNSNNGNHDTPIEVRKKHIVIVGAGPSGLLLSNLLLQRNNQKEQASSSNTRTEYQVTLIDSGIDTGKLNVQTELRKYRSWMIALAGHGLQAIRSVVGDGCDGKSSESELWNDYVSKSHVGVKVQEFNIYLGSKEIRTATDEDEPEGDENDSYVVDRNFVCAAMARFMHDKHKDNPNLQRRYETELLYVDSDNHRILVRGKNNKNEKQEEERYIDYDLLVGADGSRSVVRDSCFVRDVYNFEMDFGDIFHDFRAFHVEKPKSIGPAAICLLPNCFPNMTGILLPMPDGMSNFTIGVPRNNFDKLSPELKSDDVKVVANYVRENFKAFELVDYEDFATKWIANGRWNRTAKVHCNQYHNTKANAILMGDAAHATSPSIGMGMNTALRDAQQFCEMLEEFDDDFDRVLPAYSARRVPEGNSLTDLAFYLYCLDTKAQLVETIHMVVRSKFHKWVPWLVSDHAQNIIGQPKHTLAEAYEVATKHNVIPKHRAINDRLRQEYFERKIGMRSSDGGSSSFSTIFMRLAILGGLLGAATMLFVTSSHCFNSGE